MAFAQRETRADTNVYRLGPKKIYFAGPIPEGGWHQQIVKKEDLWITANEVRKINATGANWELPIRKRAVFNSLDYVGPYHQEDDEIVGEFMGFIDVQNGGFPSIGEADVVFIYVPPEVDIALLSLDIGYAIGLGKIILIARNDDSAPITGLSSIIAFHAAEHDLDCSNPASSLKKMLIDTGLIFHSPPERLFWSETSKLLPSLDIQHPIGRYHADFAIPDKLLAIEIDGHEWHASKEQRQRDAGRDRFLLEQGWKTIRFTGSEIVANVKKCATETEKIATSLK